MAYKTSFSRGFQSGFLTPYAVEMFFSIILSIIFLIGSFSKNNFVINIKYYVISFSKPGLILVSKPFEFISDTFHYFGDLQESKELNIFLKKENEKLKKEVDKKNFYLLENYRLKKLLKIDEKGYSQKITGRILIDPYKSNEFIFFIDLGKLNGLKLSVELPSKLFLNVDPVLVAIKFRLYI